MVLVTNMDMPSNCDNCKLRAFDLMRGIFCSLIDESVANQQYAKERHPKCPLLKPDNDNCKGE